MNHVASHMLCVLVGMLFAFALVLVAEHATGHNLEAFL